MKPAEELHRIPDCSSVNYNRRRSHQNSDQRIEGHRGRQAEGLADHLLPLAAREAGKVRNVQRDGRPKTHGRVQRRDQKLQKLGKATETRRRREHRSETAGTVVRPSQKQQAHRQKHGGADPLQVADVLDTFQNYRKVDEPERHKTNRRAKGKLGPRGSQGRNQSADRFSPDPSLDAKPSASHQSAQNGRHIRP